MTLVEAAAQSCLIVVACFNFLCLAIFIGRAVVRIKHAATFAIAPVYVFPKGFSNLFVPAGLLQQRKRDEGNCGVIASYSCGHELVFGCFKRPMGH